MWIVLLYEIRGVLKHVMEGHVLILVMGAFVKYEICVVVSDGNCAFV